MANANATLEILNANDNAAEIGGQMLSDDGQGNSLWLFEGKVANRFETEDGDFFWSGDVEGWNCSSEDALN